MELPVTAGSARDVARLPFGFRGGNPGEGERYETTTLTREGGGASTEVLDFSPFVNPPGTTFAATSAIPFPGDGNRKCNEAAAHGSLEL
jgi:hypothetical protein